MKFPVLIPNIINHAFTYQSKLKLKPGDYVNVPFGRSIKTGIVWHEFEKESKRNSSKWAGRTDSNKWVIFDKDSAKIKDIVPILITDSKDITLHGEIIKKVKAA